MRMGTLSEFGLRSVVRGHHIYKEIWLPFVGERLSVSHEEGNGHDRHAVKIARDGVIVGHVPREISREVWFFIAHGGSVICEITGHRQHGIGLEVPCTYTFYGKKKLVKKFQQLRKIFSHFY